MNTEDKRKTVKCSCLKVQTSVRRTTENNRSKSGTSKKSLLNKENLATSKENQRELNTILKESYQFLKDENNSLNNQLRKKHRKIQELKERLDAYETKLVCYEEAINLLRQSKEDKTVKQTHETLTSSRRKFQEMIRESQDIAKQSIEKYRKLESQMEEQRLFYQAELTRLKEGIKEVVTAEKVSEFTTDRKKTKSSHSSRKQLFNSYEQQLQQYRQKQKEWLAKENNLKNMLGQINKRVDSFQFNCQRTEQKAKLYKIQLEQLKEKYEIKCSKLRENTVKWKKLFSDLMQETKSTKQQIQDVKKLLSKIIRKEAQKLQRQ